MKSHQKILGLMSILLLAGLMPARAEDFSKELGFLAGAKDLFRPLLADPRELQMSLRVTSPVGKRNLGDISAGDYFGLYRWALPWQDAYLQWSLGGGVFSRFDLVSVEKENQVLDYSASMPFDLRVKKWSLRLMPNHISSHLGDDYIKRTGFLPQKYSLDSLKWLVAYEPWSWLRLYGGTQYILRYRESDLGRNVLQTGAEWTSGWWAHDHAQTFLASDFESWQRVGWNPESNTQVGVRFTRDPLDKKTLALFVEYGSGHLAYGQLFEQVESHWVLGLRFEIP